MAVSHMWDVLHEVLKEQLGNIPPASNPVKLQ